ncbi:DUF4956 domain-containing protein [Dethiothermospora halolimnae]|uniref:DUF4956 domain-containing protein n=1 Tax=Dethiothermospora halolimnae TaxID=3114390 RepID=UPI003CCC3B7C
MNSLIEQESLFTLLNGTNSFTINNIIFNIVITTILALFIYFVYKKTFSGVTYSQNFNITIVMVCIITAIIMMLIENNLALSLGMVGSLSIIRFRTAIKEPRDIGFLFWAIAVGLSAGTHKFIIAIIGSIILALLLLIFNKTIYFDYCYLLILRGSNIESKDVSDILGEYKIPSKLRMKMTKDFFVEITYEIKLKSIEEDLLIKSLKSIENIEEVHIVSYNGEVSG